MERSKSERKDVAIYIDEFQDYIRSRHSVNNFQTIFQQGRKYLSGLCLAHQDFAGIDSKLLHTIHSTCGSLISFNCGDVEARKMKSIFGETEKDPAFLKDYNAIARVGLDTFHFTTFPPPKKVREIIEDELKWAHEVPPNPFYEHFKPLSVQSPDPIPDSEYEPLKSGIVKKTKS